MCLECFTEKGNVSKNKTSKLLLTEFVLKMYLASLKKIK